MKKNILCDENSKRRMIRPIGKRFLSLLIAVIMLLSTSIFTTVSTSAVTQRTVSEALSWCESQVDKALDYDGKYGAQCVDFIYYYYQYLGVNPAGGNAIDYASNALPEGWQRIKGGTPQPGDILVYTNEPNGHVGVYASDSLMYHQAPSMGGIVLHDAKKYTSYDNYWGVIRPDFASQDLPLFSSVRAEVFDNDVKITGDLAVYGPDRYGQKMRGGGFYIGTSPEDMTRFHEDLDGTVNGEALRSIFYSMSKWYPHLVKGNTYYYKMYLEYGDKEYCSEIYSFTYGTKDDGWKWPLEGQIFGRGFDGNHKAIDIPAPTGTAVYAAKPGTVVCSSTASADASYKCPGCGYTGAGYHVVLRHSDGYHSFYDHLSSVNVANGAYVNAGQKVGEVGSTGNSTGPHLHFAISSYGMYSLVDPLTYLTPFSSVRAEVSDNDVKIIGDFGAYGPTMQTAGFYIGTGTDNMEKITETLNTNGYINGAAIECILYNMSKWYPYLVKGNIYYYKMYITRDGKEYCSDIYSFTYGTHTHSWDSGSVTKAPACTEAGTRTYTCTSCSETRTETIAATGHTAVTVAGTPATCTNTGLTDGSKCSVCGTVIIAQQTIPTTAHSYTSKVIEPTTSSQGYTLHTCSVCGDSYKDNYNGPISKPTDPEVTVTAEAPSRVTLGREFTLNIYMEGTYDGYYFEIPKYDGFIYKSSEAAANGIKVDEKSDRLAVSIMPGLESTNMPKMLIVSVTYAVDPNTDIGERTLSIENAKITNESGDIITAVLINEKKVEIIKRLAGDINGDDVFDYTDVAKLYAYFREKTTIDSDIDVDFNKDGSFDYADVAKLYAIFRGKSDF